jgi:hypothetical protein
MRQRSKSQALAEVEILDMKSTSALWGQLVLQNVWGEGMGSLHFGPMASSGVCLHAGGKHLLYSTEEE